MRCGSAQCQKPAVAWGYYLHKAPTPVCVGHARHATYTLPIERMTDADTSS